MSDKYDYLENKSKEFDSRVTILEEKVSSQAAEQRVSELEAKLEIIEQKSRNL